MRNLIFGTFRRIGDIWQQNNIVINSRYRVDSSPIEVYLIQLRMPVIFSGLPTGNMHFGHFLLTIQKKSQASLVVPEHSLDQLHTKNFLQHHFTAKCLQFV